MIFLGIQVEKNMPAYACHNFPHRTIIVMISFSSWVLKHLNVESFYEYSNDFSTQPTQCFAQINRLVRMEASDSMIQNIISK